MSGNVVRIGDSISCGDHASGGSSNVFINGMPAVHAGQKTTTGHGCFPPTVFSGPWTTTVFINGQPVALNGITKIVPHRCGDSAHDGIATSGSSSVSFEA